MSLKETNTDVAKLSQEIDALSAQTKAKLADQDQIIGQINEELDGDSRGTIFTFEGYTETINASTDTAGLYYPPDHSVVIVNARVVARKSDGTQGAGWNICAVFRRDLDVVTQISTTSTISHIADDMAWSVGFDVDARAIRLRVTGLAATDIKWRSRGNVTVAPFGADGTIRYNRRGAAPKPTIPDPTGHSGESLVSDGVNFIWVPITGDTVLPDQTGKSGYVLSTNGFAAFWMLEPPPLPDQTGFAGKYLRTDGSISSWEDTPLELPTQSGNAGKLLSTDGSAPLWVPPAAAELPSQTGNSGKILSTDGSLPSWIAPPSSLPPLSGYDGAVLREFEPGATKAFARLTLDDIDPAFGFTGFSGGTGSLELGATGATPSFSSSFNAGIQAATVNDGLGALPISFVGNPTSLSFAYNGGVSGLPSRSYTAGVGGIPLTINVTVNWAHIVTKLGGSPIKTANVASNIGIVRAFFGAAPDPGIYNEAFIESLTGFAGGRLQTGYGSNSYLITPGVSQYFWIALAAGWGSPSSWKDQTNDAFPMVIVPGGPFAVSNAFVAIPGGYILWKSPTFITSPFTLTAVP